MFSSFYAVAHGLTCFTADGITAEIMTLNYGGFWKLVMGEKFRRFLANGLKKKISL